MPHFHTIVILSLRRISFPWPQPRETLAGVCVCTLISYVSILSNTSRTLYVGVTDNLERRMVEHRSRLGPVFATRYNLTLLVYVDVFSSITAAIAREKEFKGWKRDRKLAVIESLNAGWRDLRAHRRFVGLRAASGDPHRQSRSD